MSQLSQFVRGGGVPIGAHVLAYDLPGEGYLRCGDLVPYGSAYADAIARAPGLRVYGNDVTSVAAGIGARPVIYDRVGAMFVAVAPGDKTWYSTDLRQWHAHANAQTVPPALNRAARTISGMALPTNAGIVVIGAGSSLTVPVISGAAGAACRAIAASPTYWLAATSLQGSGGELAYCESPAPTQDWRRIAAPNLGMTRCNAIAYGHAGFVCAGASASPSAGKLLVSSVPHTSAWTDLTARIPGAVGDEVLDAVYDGSHYILLTMQGLYASQDLNTFVRLATPACGAEPGGIRMTVHAGLVALAVNSGRQRLIALSRDHGATWTTLQPYLRRTGASDTAGVGTLSRAGDRWIANFSGTVGSLVDLGESFDRAPDWVGSQSSPGPGWCVRVK